MGILDAHGRESLQKPFEEMGGATQRNFIKLLLEYLIGGQRLMMRAMLDMRDVKKDTKDMMEMWLDPLKGQKAGQGHATGTTATEPKDKV